VAALHDRPAEEQTPWRFFGAFEGLHDDLELLLEQHGVERFEAAEPAFDPSRQTALRTLETEVVDQVGRIAQRVRPGFSLGPTLLQREGVAVYARANREDAEAPPAPDIDEPNPGGDLE
jgi:molecular chaperone GrpE (heat shock protein)